MSPIIADWLAQDEQERDMHSLGGDAIAVVIAGRYDTLNLNLYSY